MISRIFLIGQAPPRRQSSAEPVWGGAAGKRLSGHLGLAMETCRDLFEPLNLLRRFPGRIRHGKGDNFPIGDAWRAARRLSRRLQHRMVVVLGANVARAFGWKFERPFEWHEQGDVVAALVPHPSGICRSWNNLETRAQAREFGAQLATLAQPPEVTRTILGRPELAYTERRLVGRWEIVTSDSDTGDILGVIEGRDIDDLRAIAHEVSRA